MPSGLNCAVVMHFAPCGLYFALGGYGVSSALGG